MPFDGFRRVSRGSAENLRSKKDVTDIGETEENHSQLDKAVKEHRHDSENLNPPATTTIYARAGRGGADAKQRTQTAVSLMPSSSTLPLGGWAAAGNWVYETAREDESMRRRLAAVEAKIRQDVEMRLAMPSKTYHQHDRVMERSR